MATIAIHNHLNDMPLFGGDYASTRHALEAAIAAGITLENADLSDLDLSNASLDGANLRGALFDGSNLYGANISETDLTGASFIDGDLALACLAQSRLIDVDFSGCHFGGTLITDAHIDACVFSCPTVFTLPFADAKLGRNTYFHEGRTPMPFTAAPVVVTGLPKRIVLLDDRALIGNKVGKRTVTAVAELERLCRAA